MEQDIGQSKHYEEASFRPFAFSAPKPAFSALRELRRWHAEPSPQTSRAVSVDLLRILAACAIFYYHSGLFAQWPLFQWGEFAVATFIFLAGYCTLRYSQHTGDRLPAFWWSRFKAIYPTFAVISVLIFAVSFSLTPPKTGCRYALRDLIANLLMLSQYIGKPWMTASMWFVPFVLQVYLILPFLIKKPLRIYAMPVAFLVSGTACAAVYALHPSLPDHAYGICRNWSPLFRLPEVLFGCCLARARNLAGAVMPVALYLFYSVLVALLGVYFPQASPTLLLPIRGVAVFLVLAALTAAILPLVKNGRSGAISLFGRASFPFFLLHGPGIVFMGDKFGRNTLPWILYFALCWGGAVVFTLTFEKLTHRPKAGKNLDYGRCRA